MLEPALVLDADAALAYARGQHDVGFVISAAADEKLEVIVPALCLAEAHRRGTSEDVPYLELLASLPHVTVPGISVDDCLFLGGFAKTVGSLHLSHAVIEAARSPETQLITSARELVTRILPREWPVFDIPPADDGE